MKQAFLLMLVIFTIIGCSKDKIENQKEELEAISYTIYSDKTELFVEFKPLVVSEESRFAAHFTILGEFFKPITEGSIILTLTGTNDNITVSSNVLSNPGIFRLAITPNKAGIYKLIFDIRTKEYIDQIVIDSVIVYNDIESAIINQSKDESSGNEISYLKEQAWKVDFANQEVKKQMFFYTLRTTGQILTPPSEQAIISAKSSGIVTFNNNSYISGMPVYNGEALFSVSGSNLNEQNINADILEAKYNLNKAKADYDRASELIKDKIISEKEFITIENTYKIAKTIYNTLTNNYTGSGVRVYSPISGYINSINVKQGEFVEAGQTLAIVSQNKKLILKADLSQKYFDIINQIQSANFKTPDGKTYDTESLNGSYVVSGKSTGQDNPLIPINFQIDYRNELLPGTFVEVFLRTTRIPDALVIPVSALIEEHGVFFVYIQTSGESFEKREVNITGSNGILVQVLSGINEGERVVTKGAYQIKLSSMTGTMPAHGHEH